MTLSAQQNADHKFAEFNFWIEESNVYKHGTGTIVAKSKIEAIMDDKAIKETYHSTTSKYQDTSLNKYSPGIKQWEQFWVDNSGLTLHIQGNFDNGKIILQNNITTDEGSLSNKISWQQNEDNTVRQTWSQKTDQGKTWKVVFDGDYKSAIEN